MAKVVYYRSKCIGCGTCHEQQPALWRMSKKDGKANLLKSEDKNGLFVLVVPEAVKEETASVAKFCPVNCIKTS